MTTDPGSLCALELSAKTHFDRGQLTLARSCYERLVQLEPRSANVHLRLGTTQEWLGDWDAAAASYRRALDVGPESANVHGSLARLACRRGDYARAIESCRRALNLAPQRLELHQLLACALVNDGEYGTAIEVYRHILKLKPDSPEAIYGLGYFFESRGDLSSAAEAYRLALRLNPALADAHLHLGITHFLRGDFAEAKARFQRVRALAPNDAESETFLGHVHLLQGDLLQGWREHESRWRTGHFLRQRRRFPQPLWRGEPLAGARILLHAEQGLGDTLQFVRYVPLVAQRGGNVTLEIQPRLHRLLAAFPGARQVLRRGEALPEFDWQCPLLSLPLASATELGTIPASIPYIRPDPVLASRWGKRLAANSLRIGLVWAGSHTFPHERWRGVALKLLEPLIGIPGATFYSLQMGPAATQIKDLAPGVPLIDLQDQQEDMADTAAIVANLALVISVDTSVAHLAGAMGKPVWVLLHKSPDWRWLLDREDSPWYPSARLFRQAELGNWQDVIARVEKELRAYIQQRGPPRRNPGHRMRHS